jgi:hypothetical protein
MINSGVYVVGKWDYGYLLPLPEHYMWSLVLRDFGVSNWWMCPVSGIRNNEESKVPLNEREYYNEIFDELDPSLPRIFLEPKSDQTPNTEWLRDFNHPNSCIYVFGSAHFNPTLSFKREGDLIVSIETIKNQGLLWSHECLGILLYDRLVKSGTLL